MRKEHSSRRDFLRVMGVGVAASAVQAGSIRQVCAAESKPIAAGSERVELSEHLSVFRGPIQVGIIRDGTKALLIDCGDGRVQPLLDKLQVEVEQVLFTHHHRDQACGARALVERGARLTVPARERDYFEKVADYWNNPATRWHLYNLHPHHLMLGESVPVAAVASEGQTFSWGPARIQVLDTPGHTDGSVSYLVEVDGKRVVFCGDAIYDAGQIWELYSLQKGLTTTDYHGFLGARQQLVGSLHKIEAVRPELLVPSHGQIIHDPPSAIKSLITRLDECYDKYVAISALRHYFPKMFTEYAGRKGHMAIQPGKAVPECLRHFGTSWVLVSHDKAAFVMDCGSPNVVKQLQQLRADGSIRAVEGLWITHYHDDHVDAVPEFQRAFDCPCITDSHVAEVITDPMAWRLPCVSPSKARVDRATKDGESWDWHEFHLTAYHFPGQTLYHAALCVEAGELRMLFVGDSFTMSGIDDYCAQNRNFLGAGVGFDHCIALIDKLRPTHIFNCHVGKAFEFSADECRLMRDNLAERERLFGQLFPWDHANYGMDDSWIRCSPYEQKGVAGGEVKLDVAVMNHSAVPQTLACRAVLPRAWGGSGAAKWTRSEASPKTESQVRLTLKIPGGLAAGRYVVPIDIQYGDRDLPQFTEGIVVI